MEVDMAPMGQRPEIRWVIITESMAKIDTKTKAGVRYDLFHQGEIIADIFNTNFFLPMAAAAGQGLQGISDIVLPGPHRHMVIQIKMEIKGQGVEGPGLLQQAAHLINSLLSPPLIIAAQLQIKGEVDGIGESMIAGQATQKIDIWLMAEQAAGL